MKYDIQELNRLYWDEGLSTADIGCKLGVSSASIRSAMYYYGVKTRSPLAGYNLKRKHLKKYDADLIRHLYWEKNLSSEEIGEKLGLTAGAITGYMKRHGIACRSTIEALRLAISKGRRKRIYCRHKSKEPSNGKYTDANGYVHIKKSDYHRVDSYGYILEHIYIWEIVHQKHLPKGFVIHHLNGIRNDNRPENLVAMSRERHDTQFQPFKKRIRELETKVKLLEKALDTNQLMFNIGEN